jgi:hypothetical protein
MNPRVTDKTDRHERKAGLSPISVCGPGGLSPAPFTLEPSLC